MKTAKAREIQYMFIMKKLDDLMATATNDNLLHHYYRLAARAYHAFYAGR